MERIPVAGPWITDLEVEYVTDAVRNAWYERAPEYLDRFETAFAERHGAAHAIALPSGSAGVHLGLAAFGVGPGDEVIVPDTTWIASASPAVWLGATPVFADVDPVTWCVTPDTIEAVLTPRTKAIVAVDLYGNMPDMDAILALADPRGIPMLEDAAEAIGAEYDGKPSGTLGKIGIFSFHGSKTLTTGEGGMLITSDEAMYRRAIVLRDHGRDPWETDPAKRYWNTEIGFKYLMSPILAALGLAQLERLDQLVAKQLEVFGWYRERLGEAEGLTLNYQAPGTRSSYWLVNVLLDPSHRHSKSTVMRELAARGIDTRPFFEPLSNLPAFAKTPEAQAARERNVVAYDLAPRGIGLPSAHILTEQQIDRVCTELLDILRA